MRATQIAILLLICLLVPVSAFAASDTIDVSIYPRLSQETVEAIETYNEMLGGARIFVAASQAEGMPSDAVAIIVTETDRCEIVAGVDSGLTKRSIASVLSTVKNVASMDEAVRIASANVYNHLSADGSARPSAVWTIAAAVVALCLIALAVLYIVRAGNIGDIFTSFFKRPDDYDKRAAATGRLGFKRDRKH